MGVDLAQASTMVLGTLGLAAALVLIPQTWPYSEGIVEVISADRVTELGTWIGERRFRTLLLLLYILAPSVLALVWAWQLTYGIAPHRVLWQVVASVVALFHLLGNWPDRLVVLTVAAFFTFVADQGTLAAQTGAVVFVTWILAFAGLRRALRDAPVLAAAAAVGGEGVFERFGVPLFTIAYLAASVAAVVVLAWTIAGL